MNLPKQVRIYSITPKAFKLILSNCTPISEYKYYSEQTIIQRNKFKLNKQ